MSGNNGNGFTAQYSGGIPAPQISVPQNEAQAEKVLTGQPLALGYKAVLPLMSYYGAGGVPVLSQTLWADCELMLTHPAVSQPLSYFKAGIANVAFEIKCKRSDAGEFLHGLYKRVWERSLTQIQRSYEYGWMASEPCYREEHGRLCYDSMLDFHPLDVYALTHRNKYAGVSVHNIQSDGSTGLVGGGARGALRLWGPCKFPAKGFWFAHNKRYQRFYGQSQLWAAWRPWRRLAFRDGLEEALDGGVYRYIYGGWEVYYPPEDFPKQDGGIDYTAGRNMARQFVEQAKAGAGIAIPNSRDDKGNRKWEFNRPDTVMNFDPALNIVKYLQDSISYGIGVPPELLQASETGSGWSGRKVPLIGFYAGQLGNARAIVAAVKVQLADPLLRWNFGAGIHHEVEVKLVLPPELAGTPESKGTTAPTGGAVPEQQVTPGKDPAQTYAPAKEGATLGTATDEPITLSVSDEPPSDDLANGAAERVLDEAMAAYARLSRRIKRELIAAVIAAPISGGLIAARRVLGRWLPALTAALSDTQLAASLAGMREIAQRLKIEGERALPPGAKPDLEPWRPEPAAQVEEETSGRTAAIGTPQEAMQAPRLHLPLIDAAVADLRKRNLLTRDAFDALSAEARQQAFTVAGVESEKTLEAIRGALAHPVEQGQTKEQFVRKVQDTVDGETFLSPQQAETVFRTNVNSAYSNAQQELLDHPLVIDLFPYREYFAIHDDRVRPEHLAMETRGIQGTGIYRADDPVFQIFRPPWEFNCRCGFRAISVRDAARRGIEEAQRWLATKQPPLHPHHVEMPPWRPPDGFQRPAPDEPATTLGSDTDSAEEGNGGKELAEMYADLWNALEASGHKISHAELLAADAELDATDWYLVKDAPTPWRVVSAAQMEGYELATEKAPKGGVVVNGKHYKGGQWIPKNVVDQMTPDQKAKLHEAQAAAKAKRASRGPVDVEALKARTSGHSALSEGETTVADSRLRALHAHHGELTQHRLEELADQAERLLAKSKGNAVLEGRARKELAHINHMLHKSEGGVAERKTVPPIPQPGKVYNVRTDELHIDPERFQYKLNTDKSGVTQELKSVRSWNPDFAGVISVWKDPADGKTYVVNGHHRRELAGRLDVHDLAVRYIKAGSAKEARATGALINIAEGRGTAVDAAKFLRDSGVSIDELGKHGVSLKGKVAADASFLTRLSDRSFDRLARGQLEETKALAVAKHLADHDLQDQLFKLLEKREDEGKDLSPRVIEEMARQMAETPKTKTTEHTLFGDIDGEESLFVPRAEVAASVRAGMAKEVNDWLAVSSKRRAEKVGGAGNVLNVEENKKIAEQADQVKNVFDQLANRKGQISDALNAAAEEYHKAKSKRERDAIREHALQSVRDAVLREAGFGREADAGREDGSAGGGEETNRAESAAEAASVSADAGRRDTGDTGLEPTAHAPKVAAALDRFANRAQAAQGGGIFGGEDLQARQGFAKLPDGAPVVFTDGEFAGQTGKIVHDKDPTTGAHRIVAKVDGRDGLVPIGPQAIEPLDKHLSWRTAGGGAGAEKPQQRSLLEGQAPPPAANPEELPPDMQAHRAIVQQLNEMARAGKSNGEIGGVPVERVSVGNFRATIGGKTVQGDQQYIASRIQEAKAKAQTLPIAKNTKPRHAEHMPGLTHEERAIESRSQKMAEENYPSMRENYLRGFTDSRGNKVPGNGSLDDKGNLKSVVLNTDDWRTQFPDYTGTNAQAVHEPSAWLNGKLWDDAREGMKGKGNNRVLVLAGGGGSGKGTAVDQHFDQAKYPIRLDQVSSSLSSLEKKMKEAQDAGYQPEYLFVDRHPADAWQGVVGRAQNGFKKTGLGRTVPIHIALKDNINARKVAIEVLKTHPEWQPQVINNNLGQGKAKLITNRDEAIAHLEQQNHDMEKLLPRLKEETLKRWEAGEISDPIAAGLLGNDTVVAAKNRRREKG